MDYPSFHILICCTLDEGQRSFGPVYSIQTVYREMWDRTKCLIPMLNIDVYIE